MKVMADIGLEKKDQNGSYSDVGTKRELSQALRRAQFKADRYRR
jgi:hypothetical protein